MSDRDYAVPRIAALDAVRGFLILGMVLVHLAVDMAGLGWIPPVWLHNPAVHLLRILGAGVFILMSGMTARYSHHNLRRGLLLLLCAMGVTLATALTDADQTIWFGVLHFLAVSRLLYAAIRPLCVRLRGWRMPVFCAALLAGLQALLLLPAPVGWLLPFGWNPEALVMADYYPLFPWIAVFLLGTWLGERVFSDRLPGWAARIRQPALEWVGRRSLWIYLGHQPVLLIVLGFLEMVFGSAAA